MREIKQDDVVASGKHWVLFNEVSEKGHLRMRPGEW